MVTNPFEISSARGPAYARVGTEEPPVHHIDDNGDEASGYHCCRAGPSRPLRREPGHQWKVIALLSIAGWAVALGMFTREKGFFRFSGVANRPVPATESFDVVMAEAIAAPQKPETPNPTRSPTPNPTQSPTLNPTRSSTSNPTRSPTSNPTRSPTSNATRAPTPNPTRAPTPNPTRAPAPKPTRAPALQPTRTPPTTSPPASLDLATQLGAPATAASDLSATTAPSNAAATTASTTDAASSSQLVVTGDSTASALAASPAETSAAATTSTSVLEPESSNAAIATAATTSATASSEVAPATTDEEHDAANVGHADDGAAPSIRPACRAAPDASAERLWLTVTGLPFHGTTALEMLLMSSAALATICSANTWQCEPCSVDDKKQNWFQTPETLAKFLGVAPVACASCPRAVCVPAGARLIRDELERYAPYWDLRRPVLMTKWEPSWSGFLKHVCPPGEQGAATEREHLGRLQALAPSPALARAGVRRVRWATVLVHRPWCLWPLSSNARQERQQNVTLWARRELAKVEELATEHRRHVAEGRPALIVLLADLLWKSRQAARQVERFLPCAGTLDADFTPALGVDVFAGNWWKASGSLVEYGAKKDPRALGYDTGGPGLGAGVCTQPQDQLYADLPSEAERRRAEEVEAYFARWTGVGIVGEADA